MGGLAAAGQYMPLAAVHGMLGAVCLWAWAFGVLFMGKTLASLGHLALPVGSIQIAAFAGLACALFAIVLVSRRVGRGPEPDRRVAVLIGCMPVVLMVAAVFAVREGVVGAPAVLVAWVLSGASASYALRRCLALFEAFACGLSDARALRMFAQCCGGAALVGMAVSRMDELGATVATCAGVPLALWLLPQGRLSLAPRTEQSREAARVARSKAPAGIAALVGCLAVAGVVFGFQTSVGDVLYSASPDSPTLVYIVLLVTAVLMGAGLSRVPLRQWRFVARALCALCVIAVAPMLFLSYEASSLAWRLCQNGLLLGTACLCSVLGFALARGGFGAARQTDGVPGLVGTTLFLAAMVAGRMLGGALVQGPGAASVPFQMGVLVLAALLLVCGSVLSLGLFGQAGPAECVRGEADSACVGRDPVGNGAAPTGAGLSGACGSMGREAEPSQAGFAHEMPATLGGAAAPIDTLDGAPAGAASVPTAAAPEALAVCAAHSAMPSYLVSPGATPLARRCNEVAWRYGLSEREHDVLLLLARGLNAQQVAERMVVSRNTVKSHMAHIYNKVSIHTRAELDAILAVDAAPEPV